MANVGELEANADSWQALAGKGGVLAARGAANLATIATFRLAAKRAATADEHGARVRRLRTYVAAVEPVRRAHVAALIDAALAAEAAARMGAGLVPHDHLLTGWMDDASGPAARPHGPGSTVLVAAAAAFVARYRRAADVDDVDLVLARSVVVIRRLIACGGRSPAADGVLDELEVLAFALCVWPAATRAEADDRRRPLTILWLVLRRRRPLAAAVVRAMLTLDRRGRHATLGEEWAERRRSLPESDCR